MNFKYKNQEGQLKQAALLLSEQTGMSLMVATVCVNRGMATPESVHAFLNPKLDQLTHPFKVLDLEKAVDHIFAHPQKIRIFTDYDVDGTTGAALLTWFFREMKFDFSVRQPDRFKDGYGLNIEAIEQASKDGIETFITIDCGITNFDAAIRAKELGIKLIIVDHHQIDPLKGLPEAFAVIDPQREDDPSQLKQLCGCALAFYLSLGIRIKARDAGYFTKNKIFEPNLKNLLDLVVIATAADMVPITGDNRILVKHGLDILRTTQKPGLRALMETAGIEVKTTSPMSLGFSLGPRINASGRMGTAETAYRCLTTQNREEGFQLAQELEGINKARAELQNHIWDEVRQQIDEALREGKFSSAIVVASKNWHEGVVGIVASKVVDHFKKPAIVLAIREDGLAKGSVRSYGGYHVLEALHLSKDYLKGYGGHKYAAGLSLDPDKIAAFTSHYNQMIASLSPSQKEDQVEVEAECLMSDLKFKDLEELEKLAPFGPGNPEPLFAMRAKVLNQRVLKQRHLKLNLESNGEKLEAIWFNAAEKLEYTALMEKSAQFQNPCLFAGIPEINRFMGKSTPNFRIKTARQIP